MSEVSNQKSSSIYPYAQGTKSETAIILLSMWEFWGERYKNLTETVTEEKDRFEKFQGKNQGTKITSGGG